MTWTADKIATLQRLLADGMQTEEIRRSLSMTRNQIIGKATRLGLKLNGVDVRNAKLVKLNDSKRIRALYADGMAITNIAKIMKVSANTITGRIERDIAAGSIPRRPNIVPKAQAEKIMASPVSMLPDRDLDPGVTGVTIMDLTTYSCRWPLNGAGEDTVFCGEAQDKDCPYCAKHRATAWTGAKMITGKRRHG